MIYTVPQYSGAQLGGGRKEACSSRKKACPPPQKAPPFCNLAIHEILGKRKGVYCVFLDIFTKPGLTFISDTVVTRKQKMVILVIFVLTFYLKVSF